MAATMPRPQGARSGGVAPNLKAPKGSSLIARPSTPSRLSTVGTPGGLLSTSKSLQHKISVSSLSQASKGQRSSLSPPNALAPNRRLTSMSKVTSPTEENRKLSRKSTSNLSTFQSAEDSGLLSVLPSPPPSRSGSAQGSYTDVTAIDGSHCEGLPIKSEGGGGKELKGNVVVSVRCRPDASGNGEDLWVVDPRNSHIVYRGGEGGDYIYG